MPKTFAVTDNWILKWSSIRGTLFQHFWTPTQHLVHLIFLLRKTEVCWHRRLWRGNKFYMCIDIREWLANEQSPLTLPFMCCTHPRVCSFSWSAVMRTVYLQLYIFCIDALKVLLVNALVMLSFPNFCPCFLMLLYNCWFVPIFFDLFNTLHLQQTSIIHSSPCCCMKDMYTFLLVWLCATF